MRLIDADALIKDVDGDLLDGIAEARAIEKIDNAPTVATDTNVLNKWISVKDRLPEHSKKYLIYATSGDNKVGYITTATFGGHFVLTGRRAYWKVTHWMPLPEPPQEVKRG